MVMDGQMQQNYRLILIPRILIVTLIRLLMLEKIQKVVVNLALKERLHKVLHSQMKIGIWFYQKPEVNKKTIKDQKFEYLEK